VLFSIGQAFNVLYLILGKHQDVMLAGIARPGFQKRLLKLANAKIPNT
jgi:hypothetical protein